MPGVGSLLKPRNLRIVVMALVVTTIFFAVYHLYYSPSYGIEPSPLPDVSAGRSISEDIEGAVVVDVDQGAGARQVWTPRKEYGRPGKTDFEGQTCPRMNPFKAAMDSLAIFPSLKFQEDWISQKEYWNPLMEDRYNDLQKSSETPYKKIIVVPHSHNDPGWLKTFEGYFNSQTKQILDNLVEKLTEHRNMTFLWSEISFLNKWWRGAHPERRKMFKTLVEEGRLEMVTGGWVMTDEATVNLYSMIDQLVEGHQWIDAQLGVKPKSSWSIDPFGHGSTFPYILKRAGLDNMVVQRVHYAWKKWFAENQAGDFHWVQRWDRNQKNAILCHNAPFDIYSIKHSCGPRPYVCLNFDFRSIPGQYMENYRVMVPISKENIKERADLLMEQYGRTASLFPHNVAMISLGDDFRYDQIIEFDQQYTNYMQLFEYINAHKDKYKAEVGFGTVSDYFKAVHTRTDKFNTFSGDFFVYSDIFSEGRPAYWSGYFGTRPYWKKFYRETENNLRNAEFLFTIGYAMARQKNDRHSMQVYEQEYTDMVVARQWLGLFAHHDATTGTSKAATMNDYGQKLMEAMQTTQNIQLSGMNSLLFGSANASNMRTDYELSAFGDLPRKIPLSFNQRDGKELIQNLVVFNSLGWKRSVLTRTVVAEPHVQVFDPEGKPVVAQLNPIIEATEASIRISAEVFELIFMAEVEAFSTATFKITKSKPKGSFAAVKSVVYCRDCGSTTNAFEVNAIQDGDVQLNNEYVQLLFDRNSGMLQSIKKLQEGIEAETQMTFGGYSSIDYKSGAYLLALDTRSRLQIPFSGADARILIISGPVSSELSVFHSPIQLSTSIFHRGGKQVEDAIFVENLIDLGRHSTEMYMRFQTNLKTEGRSNPASSTTVPVFYTDQNGLTMEKRVKVEEIGIQGNYYPTNTMSFIQDEDKKVRFSVLMDRSHGFSSFETGRLETLVERRTMYDDARGMGEGVTDNRPTVSNYVILLEKVNIDSSGDLRNSLPTKLAVRASHELIYTPPKFIFSHTIDSPSPSTSFKLFNQALPCDANILSLKTLVTPSDNLEVHIPKKQALMILQKFAFNCLPEEKQSCGNTFFYPDTSFKHLQVSSIRRTDLTGVSTTGSPFNQLSQVTAEPFDLSSIIVTFA